MGREADKPGATDVGRPHLKKWAALTMGIVLPFHSAAATAVPYGGASFSAPDERGCFSAMDASAAGCTGPATGIVRHYSSTAGAGGDGSRKRPLNDLQAAIDSLSPGDTLMILNGTHAVPFDPVTVSGKSGTPCAPIRIRGESAGAAVLSGALPAYLAPAPGSWTLVDVEKQIYG